MALDLFLHLSQDYDCFPCFYRGAVKTVDHWIGFASFGVRCPKSWVGIELSETRAGC